HGYLDPKVFKLFAGVEHILHAGDIGFASIILELEEIAPVTAVYGNTDVDMPFKETEVIQIGRQKFLVHHIVNPHSPGDRVKERILRAQPNVVVFGHTHKRFNEMFGGILFFNPGYSGKPKHGVERSVAILHYDTKEIRAEFLPL
ncbi:MAG TPA: metallophosphoesterase family protein, partial [Candidatus Baltobacteraceae bacterium]|nr:metallophosphoesterase family protein [Candidatus Baltobacteraceae bacterium]